MLGSAATLVVTSEEEISWPQNPVFVSTLDLHCFQIYGEALSRDAVEKSAAYCNNGNTCVCIVAPINNGAGRSWWPPSCGIYPRRFSFDVVTR